jgi:hypothetical protein
MIGLEINPSPSGVETPKRKRRRELSKEHRIKISEGIQKAWASKHYAKAIGLWGAPPVAYAEELKEAWRLVARLKIPMTKPVEAATFDYARLLAKEKQEGLKGAN